MNHAKSKKSLEQSTDQELVILSLAKNDLAFNLLIKRYLKLVYSVISQYIEDEDEKEDAVQEVFVKIWKNLKKFDINKKISNWIWEIAKNTALDYLKKRKSIVFSDYESRFGQKIENQLVDQNAYQEKQYENKEFTQKLNLAMASLDAGSKKAISWRHQKELSFAEVSKLEKKPLNTVKSQYWRAIQKLKKII